MGERTLLDRVASAVDATPDEHAMPRYTTYQPGNTVTEEEQKRFVRKLKFVGLATSALLLIGVGYVLVLPTQSTDRSQYTEVRPLPPPQ